MVMAKVPTSGKMFGISNGCPIVPSNWDWCATNPFSLYITVCVPSCNAFSGMVNVSECDKYVEQAITVMFAVQ